MASTADITALLARLQAGDDDAASELFPRVYEDLCAIARGQRQRWSGDPTLNATALVHEAYLRLVDHTTAPWSSRKHFFVVASMAMRQILVNYARRRRTLKRGGGDRIDELDPWLVGSEDRVEVILAVDEALERLAAHDERQARVVEQRFFAGLSEAEIAAALDISERTVRREWTKARAWLLRDLGPGAWIEEVGAGS